jgi:Winged helix-turn helix
MPPAAVPVMLTASQRTTLNSRVRGAATCWRDRLRAQRALAAARNRPDARIADGLRISEDTVRKWRGRCAALGLAGLQDLPRSGRPRRISEADRAAVAKARLILDLYQGFYQGEPLGPGDRILSFDAKPSIQARSRATVPAAPGRPVRVEHEYIRRGALTLLAGLDVHTGQVFASTPQTTGITPFTGPRRPGAGPPGVPGRAAGVRHRRQRPGPPRQDRRQPAPRSAPEHGHDPAPRSMPPG